MILITGLTGTSGSAFYKLLCENNFSEKIRVVVRTTTNMKVFDNTPLDIEFVVGDIADINFLNSVIQGCRLVFHIASKTIAQKIVEAICNAPQKPFACMVSSTIVYSNYYRTSYLKEDEEKYIKKFQENGIKYVFIRPTMIFGTPTDQNISLFSRWIKKYRVFPIVKNGNATIQPVHKDDLAQAYYMILMNCNNLQKKEYIVSGKDKMTLSQLFKEIAEVLNTKTSFVNIPFPIAAFVVNMLYFISFKKFDYREKLDRLTEDRAYSHIDIQIELGYSPMSFKDRLRQTIDTYNDYV